MFLVILPHKWVHFSIQGITQVGLETTHALTFFFSQGGTCPVRRFPVKNLPLKNTKLLIYNASCLFYSGRPNML
jgi:hypothetical protein